MIDNNSIDKKTDNQNMVIAERETIKKKSPVFSVIRWILLLPAIAIAFLGTLFILSFILPPPWTQALVLFMAMCIVAVIITPSERAKMIVVLLLSVAYFIYAIDGFIFYWNAPYEFDAPMTNAEEMRFYMSGMIIAIFGLIGSIFSLMKDKKGK